MKDVGQSVPSYKYARGPHNLGDPDDKSLRKVEKDVLIPQRMRDKAKQEKCVQEVQDFTECCKKSSVLMVYKCKKENAALKECLALWYNNPSFREQCTKEYLEDRSEYRRTGVPKKARQARMLSST